MLILHRSLHIPVSHGSHDGSQVSGSLKNPGAVIIEVSIGGANFFGGTMWTDFNGGDLRAMETARSQMNDYRVIYNRDESPFTPADSIALHKNFASKLLNWFGKNLSGPRVVISHNAPVINPNSKYKGGPLTPAFNSLDMVEIIGTHQPALWVYGHAHECDDQTIGRTRIISNQLGYPGNFGGFECKDFDEAGLPVEIPYHPGSACSEGRVGRC